MGYRDDSAHRHSQSNRKAPLPFDEPLRQFDLKAEVIYGLENGGVDYSIAELAVMTPAELGDLIRLNERHGEALLTAVKQFPTVSMGLGPLQAIYQARFLNYLEHRNLLKLGKRKVWAFLGDGEMDEPESLGAISLAGREKLDHLISSSVSGTATISKNQAKIDELWTEMSKLWFPDGKQSPNLSMRKLQFRLISTAVITFEYRTHLPSLPISHIPYFTHNGAYPVCVSALKS